MKWFCRALLETSYQLPEAPPPPELPPPDDDEEDESESEPEDELELREDSQRVRSWLSDVPDRLKRA